MHRNQRKEKGEEKRTNERTNEGKEEYKDWEAWDGIKGRCSTFSFRENVLLFSSRWSFGIVVVAGDDNEDDDDGVSWTLDPDFILEAKILRGRRMQGGQWLMGKAPKLQIEDAPENDLPLYIYFIFFFFPSTFPRYRWCRYRRL